MFIGSHPLTRAPSKQERRRSAKEGVGGTCSVVVLKSLVGILKKQLVQFNLYGLLGDLNHEQT